jgi:hypothetical protein
MRLVPGLSLSLHPALLLGNGQFLSGWLRLAMASLTIRAVLYQEEVIIIFALHVDLKTRA